jgi:hypothetical protein
MDNALGRRNHNVVEEIKAYMKHKISSVGLILAGHSLGGGYAQLVALDMFDQAIDDAQLRAPTEVITFGAPQVIIPPSEGEGRSIKVWTKLNDVCTMIINSFDPVPRVTGEFCEPWLDVVLDIARNTFSLGGVFVDPAVVVSVQSTLTTQLQIAELYRTIGTVWLINKTGHAYVLKTNILTYSADFVVLSVRPTKRWCTLKALLQSDGDPACHSMLSYIAAIEASPLV